MPDPRSLLEGPARAGKTRVIAIDGRSGAGKSSLAAVLSGELGAPVVALEDLYGGWDGLERGIDLLVSEVLEPLRAGRAARVPRYDWVARQWGEPWTLEPPGVLIVEGVGAGVRRAVAYASKLIWIEEPEPVRKKRSLDRDGTAYAPYWDQWAAQEEAMLAREHTPERADLIITATDARRALAPEGRPQTRGRATGSGLDPAQAIVSALNSITVRAASVTEPDRLG